MSRKHSRAETLSMNLLVLTFFWVVVGDQFYQAVGTDDWRSWLAAIVLPPLVLIVGIGLFIASFALDSNKGDDE